MMTELVPITSPAIRMASSALKVWPRAQLPTSEGQPRTLFITRQQASQLQVEAMVSCLHFMMGKNAPVMVLCGGGASAAFQAHPEPLKFRFQVTEEELDTELVDLRLSRAGEHFIAIFDPNRLHAAVDAIVTLRDLGVPVDLIYVADRTETRSPFVRRCEQEGLSVIVVEQRSALGEPNQGRLQFPGIPRQLNERYQEGAVTFVDLLDSGTPAARSGYYRSAAEFLEQLRGSLHD